MATIHVESKLLNQEYFAKNNSIDIPEDQEKITSLTLYVQVYGSSSTKKIKLERGELTMIAEDGTIKLFPFTNFDNEIYRGTEEENILVDPKIIEDPETLSIKIDDHRITLIKATVMTSIPIDQMVNDTAVATHESGSTQNIREVQESKRTFQDWLAENIFKAGNKVRFDKNKTLKNRVEVKLEGYPDNNASGSIIYDPIKELWTLDLRPFIKSAETGKPIKIQDKNPYQLKEKLSQQFPNIILPPLSTWRVEKNPNMSA